MTPAKITGFSIQDFKRIRLVEIHPTENGLTILGGRNAQGKSSCLDAIAYALGGENFRPSDINNHDAEKNATIRVEIDGLIVERSGKNAALKITDSRGMKGNQTLLNEIVGKFALDLGGFMKAGNVEKAKMLLKMFPDLAQQLDQLKIQADEIRACRADLNRDIKKLQYQFDEMIPYPDLPAEEISLMELSQRLNDVTSEELEILKAENNLTELQRHSQAAGDVLTEARQNKIKAENDLAELENYIKQLRLDTEAAVAESQRLLEAAERGFSAAESRYQLEKSSIDQRKAAIAGVADQIRTEIGSVDDLNKKIRHNQERKKIFSQMDEIRKKANDQTARLDELDRTRTALLQNAELPLVELSINDDGELLYRGQQWDCMSGAERLKVATSICMKSKPGCGFVLIDGLEAMDPQTLKEFGEYLSQQNIQGIGTIVGDTAATVIIEDGCVLEEFSPAQESEKNNPKMEE